MFDDIFDSLKNFSGAIYDTVVGVFTGETDVMIGPTGPIFLPPTKVLLPPADPTEIQADIQPDKLNLLLPIAIGVGMFLMFRGRK